VAARELAQRGKKIVNIGAEESLAHVVNFRGTTGIRATREHITRAAGEEVFWKFAGSQPAHLAAAYDNILLGALYEAVFGQRFATDAAGTRCAASMTVEDLRRRCKGIEDEKQRAALTEKFARSRAAILRMAEREGLELTIPPVLVGEA
jgi:hypothetical protein